ncbi:hypothetical protein QR680_001068 [Steinernema hermaphroditum]|uniref:glutaminase n=1 Tax=Steinernema hermaphroditum TaxID=289476 RepID=A0AA39GYU4_9BILA|nr:hypothetical protein QR680_001068 [Steinernema hermaphroditum]
MNVSSIMHSSPAIRRTSMVYTPSSSAQKLMDIASRLQRSPSRDLQTAEDLIFDLFKLPNRDEASIGKLLSVLKSFGLHEDDPRLRPMMDKVRAFENELEERLNEAKDPKHWKLRRTEFKKCIAESVVLITQALQNNLIVPSWSQFTTIIREIYYKCLSIETGSVATYIPQLARVDPNQWGVSICTVDGQRISFGDSNTPFCIQSVSKAFNYAVAASDLGADIVHKYVGQEPSGRLFNEICLDATNKPHNPMVNSGAIIVTSLIKNSENMADRFDYMLTQYRKISGGEYVGFNNATFLSERATADRNCALAYFMKENGCFPAETQSINEALDFYFQLCSLEATCESMSVMAATLANGGVCPITGERCISSRPCRDVLSLMYSCGMYDYSGQFSFHVGLPAKSGVSGVMIVVVPNVMGIALWSPPLDNLGNSCRGVAFCKELVNRFNFHNYDSLAHAESTKFDPRKRIGEHQRDQVVELLFAAQAGDLNAIRRFYLQGCDLDIADYDYRTAIHLAASEGHYEMLKFLINVAKVKVEPKDRWNRIPLDDAREFRHLECVRLLEKVSQQRRNGLDSSLTTFEIESPTAIDKAKASVASTDSESESISEDETEESGEYMDRPSFHLSFEEQASTP